MTDNHLKQIGSRKLVIWAHKLQEETSDWDKMFEIARQYNNYYFSLRILGRDKFAKGLKNHLLPTDYSEVLIFPKELPDSELAWKVILYVGRSVGREKETRLLISSVRRGNYLNLLPFELN